MCRLHTSFAKFFYFIKQCWRFFSTTDTAWTWKNNRHIFFHYLNFKVSIIKERRARETNSLLQLRKFWRMCLFLTMVQHTKFDTRYELLDECVNCTHRSQNFFFTPSNNAGDFYRHCLNLKKIIDIYFFIIWISMSRS